MLVFRIASGNTFGATSWSDGKCFAPFLPNVSPIFKCESCGHYYRIDNQPVRSSDSLEFGGRGVFDFDDLKAAREQFENENMSLPDGFGVMLVQAYNDKYYRSESAQRTTPTMEDKMYFLSVVDELLLEVEKLDPFFVAELYRETEQYDKCLEQLSKYNDEDRKEVKDQIAQKARLKRSEVFEVIWN